jgi:hypothetical protein
MNIFRCQSCDHREYAVCGLRGHPGVSSDRFLISALEPAENDRWRPAGLGSQQHLYRMCRNYFREQVCNWRLPAGSESIFCEACRFNKT